MRFGLGGFISGVIFAMLGCAQPEDHQGPYTIGGTVTGLVGNAVLQNNQRDDLTVSVNGPFMFATALDGGSAYQVTVLSQTSPTDAQVCSVLRKSGTVASANITDITVSCAPPRSFKNDVVPIFAASCSCHTSPSPDAELSLTAANAYQDLINVNSNDFGSKMPRVKPEDPEYSYLIAKLRGKGPYYRDPRMPKFGPYFSADRIKPIEDWITQGALNN
ncbi:MAG: hypothetical protein OEW08_13815 [Gammaproteobacteria bacterium]|nr:hypothetical protein [Gammaproteobacteria bacterium]